MIRMSSRTFIVPGLVAIFCMALLASPAAAAIVKIQSVQSCSVYGLDTSIATAQGGVHCPSTTNNAFSLQAFLSNQFVLYIGNSTTPSWNFINDTGQVVTDLTIEYWGSLASNSSIDMQVIGTDIFTSCTSWVSGVAYYSANCGTGDITPNGPTLPVVMRWTGGTGIPIGGTFNIGTSSFAHAGQDAGYLVPDGGTTVTLLGLALAGIGLLVRRIR